MPQLRKYEFLVGNPYTVLINIFVVLTVILFRPAYGAQESNTVKVGYLPIYVDLPLFVAKEQKLFEKHGISVDMVRFESSPDLGVGLLNGGLDAAASISTTVALSLESRDPGRLKVYAVDAPNKHAYLDSIVVLKSSGITSLSQLKGKKVGSFPGPGAALFGKMVLEKAGLKPDTDVLWVELPAGQHLSALETKTIDALLTYEPMATQAVLEKGAVRLMPGAIESQVIDPWQAGSWIITKPFLEGNPDVARRFILAINDAIDVIRANPQQAKNALTSYTSIKPEVAAASVNSPITKVGEVDVQTLQRNADLLTSKKVLSKHINVEQMLIKPTFLQLQAAR